MKNRYVKPEIYGGHKPKCDRDALLGLADELEDFAEMGWCAGSIDDPESDRLVRFAGRIREACSVFDSREFS